MELFELVEFLVHCLGVIKPVFLYLSDSLLGLSSSFIHLDFTLPYELFLLDFQLGLPLCDSFLNDFIDSILLFFVLLNFKHELQDFVLLLLGNYLELMNLFAQINNFFLTCHFGDFVLLLFFHEFQVQNTDVWLKLFGQFCHVLFVLENQFLNSTFLLLNQRLLWLLLFFLQIGDEALMVLFDPFQLCQMLRL